MYGFSHFRQSTFPMFQTSVFHNFKAQSLVGMLLPRFLCTLAFLAQVNCLSYTVTARVYMDIKHKNKNLGRIVIALFGEDAPNTVRNFRHICIKGIKGQSYVGSTFHRVVPRFMVQGGDVESKDGMGSISLYGKHFDDEGFNVEHNRPGYVGMANRGPNTNGCQFYITTVSASFLNGKHTVFGKVIEGLDVVHQIEYVSRQLIQTLFIKILCFR